jgi:hypothetical protein
MPSNLPKRRLHPGALRANGLISVLITVFILSAVSLPTRAAAGGGVFKERFSGRLGVLTYGTLTDAAISSQNPGNAFLDLPDGQARLDVRPDLYMDLAPLDLSIKPRLRLHWQHWDVAANGEDTDWDNEGYVNEWLARLSLSDSFFISYGRENLQWGPSYMLSPSNPFFTDNGRANPKQEVDGMDFARMVWLPGLSWTVSLIANTDPGRQPDDSNTFEPTYAVKVDYVGEISNGGVVFSDQKEDRPRLGLYGGLTATDALLLYAEAGLARGTPALYPVAGGGYFGAGLEPILDQSDDVEILLLLGGAYTLEMGPTLSLEYVYNSSGYNDDQAELFYQLREAAGDAFAMGGPLQGPAAGILAQTVDPGLRLLRRNYLMFQFSQNDIGDALNLVLRYTYNLDDNGGQFIAIAEYFIGDHVSLFSIGTVNSGPSDTEFGSIIARQWMAGVQYAF